MLSQAENSMVPGPGPSSTAGGRVPEVALWACGKAWTLEPTGLESSPSPKQRYLRSLKPGFFTHDNTNTHFWALLSTKETMCKH